MIRADFVVIGGGIVGLSIAREIQKRQPSSSVVLLEKEVMTGQHASGRNSGVLHSGIYYTADSLKARFTRNGNQAWQEYCCEMNLPLDRCGKLVLAPNEDDHKGLDVLESRGARNNVEVNRLDEYETCQVEPRAKTLGHSLFVPSTSTVDPRRINASMTRQFVDAGGQLHIDSPYLESIGGNTVRAGKSKYVAGHVVNCAGLYADHIAKDFGFGVKYSVLPFKGIYLYASNDSVGLRTHVYPVPDLSNPFLGVHFTRTVYGETKIGPTAIPALWREQYHLMDNFRLNELVKIGAREMKLFFTNHNNFRKLAWQELKKQSKRRLVGDAGMLIDGAKDMGFYKWGKPGMRAQLMDVDTGSLVMDFVVEGDEHSTHVLNAVSPGFTCALPFAAYVVDGILG